MIDLGIRTNDLGELCPVMACAACGSALTRHQNAMVTWPSEDTSGLVAVHKGCSYGFERSHQSYRHAPWLEMREFLRHLSGNVGMRVLS